MKTSHTEPMLDHEGNQVSICGFPVECEWIELEYDADEQEVREAVDAIVPDTKGSEVH